MSAPHKLPESPYSEPSPCIELALEVLTMLELLDAGGEAFLGNDKSHSIELMAAYNTHRQRVTDFCTAAIATLAPDITFLEETETL